MRTVVDDRLRDEVRRFHFRFACEDCVHYDDRTSRCSLSYPPAPRRNAIDSTHLELCKDFDLG